MQPFKHLPAIALLLGCLPLLSLAIAQESSPVPPDSRQAKEAESKREKGAGQVGLELRDISKSIIEFPVEVALTETPAPQERRRDVSKILIESPFEAVVSEGTAPQEGTKKPPVSDLSKMKIETGAKELAADLADDVRDMAEALMRAEEAENPRVAPGRVYWHDSFAEACTAARESGKPVLLFQLLGQLDQRFT